MKTIDQLSPNVLSLAEPSTQDIFWFVPQDKHAAKHTIDRLLRRRVSALRLGLDCAEFNSKNGKKWYGWLIPKLAEKFDLTVCVDNFSKSGQNPRRSKRSLAQIVEHVVFQHGAQLARLELWRNPISRANYPANVFSEDVVFAATWARHLGAQVRLGVVRQWDTEWMSTLRSSQIMGDIDFVDIAGVGSSYLPALITAVKQWSPHVVSAQAAVEEQESPIAC